LSRKFGIPEPEEGEEVIGGGASAPIGGPAPEPDAPSETARRP
jgi:hypothetical protein